MQQAKGYREGTHRARPPAETFAAYRRLLPEFGITRIANVTGLDAIGLPVYVAVRPSSRSLATAQGKGADPAAARTSAMMEAIECWHAEHVEGALRYDSFRALCSREHVLDIRRLPRRGAAAPPERAPMLWIEGWELLASRPVLVPYECVTMSCVAPPGGFVFTPTSNGLASGNHALEAIVHGLCEVIERDALTLWELGGAAAAKARQLELTRVGDVGCDDVLRRLRDAGIRCAAWEITSDVGVPTYAAEIYDPPGVPGWGRLGIYGGYGAHLAAEVALIRALNEAVQSRLTFVSGSRDDLLEDRYAQDPTSAAARIERHESPAPRHHLRAHGPGASDSFEQDLARLLSALRAVGVDQVAVVDLSRPEYGIPVVKVVVPGLEGRLSSLTYAPVNPARVASHRAQERS
ncbi:MAG: YcaO-like family protein [Myxococcales bacterium]|nr:YcaO-like family protein [Myxococcales bacterium]